MSRYWYNQAVEYLRQKDTKAYLPTVRKLLQDPGRHDSWSFECPQRIRDHAMADACRSVKQAKRTYLKTGAFNEVHFRSKKAPVQGLAFDAISLGDHFVFSNKSRRVQFEERGEKWVKAEKEGTRILFEDGRWFLIVPQGRATKKPENQRLGSVALDPGVRNFLTLFSESVVGEIGSGDFKKIYRLCLGLDKMLSKQTKAKALQKQNLKRAIQRQRAKIKDLIGDLHKKVAHFLVTNFDVVFLPTFETSKMVSNLHSKTARMMLTFAHFKFKQFLKELAEIYSCRIIDVSEAYTSKTCSYCGQIQEIGSKKQFNCKKCGVSVSRDRNGARGIYLRALMATSTVRNNRATVSIC